MTLVTHLSLDDNRRTPEHILALVRELWPEGIDLDPASDPVAQQSVQAKAWFGAAPYLSTGRADWLGWDSLECAWGPIYNFDTELPHGARVWLNPPGGMVRMQKGLGRESSAAMWWAKLQHEYQVGHVSEALFLGFTLEILRTAQKWGTPPQAYPMCVPKDRLEFPSSSGENSDSPATGSCIVYLGREVERFREVFGKVGYCT
jgi:hypothetical protein